MGWIRRLFGFKEKNIIWKINPNGMNFHEAMVLARDGWKVRSIQWRKQVDKHVFYEDGEFLLSHHKKVTDYSPTTAEQFGGMQWQTCGKDNKDELYRLGKNG